MIKQAFLAFVLLFLVRFVTAQELYCKVQIQYQQIQGVDPSVFEEMEKAIFEFMNNRKWSGTNFQLNERIEATLIFTIQNAVQGGSEFSGTLNVVLQRPIYGTDYNSVVINLVDNDIAFRYSPFQAMEYADNTYTNNLTHILAFYAYLMLGLDFDTFSLFGGAQYLEKAMTVASVAQNSPYQGWQAFEGPRNRFQLIENLTNSSYNGIRKLLYEYHRLGLDIMTENIDEGRTVITNSLSNLKEVYDKRPNLYSLQVVLEAKRQEIINIYQEASPAEKVAMINLMSAVDPPNGNKYEAVNK
jgi:hypothetical protein